MERGHFCKRCLKLLSSYVSCTSDLEFISADCKSLLEFRAIAKMVLGESFFKKGMEVG